MKWLKNSKSEIQNEVTIDAVQTMYGSPLKYKQVSYVDDQRDGRFSTAVPYDMEIPEIGEKMLLSDLIQGYVELQELIAEAKKEPHNEAEMELS